MKGRPFVHVIAVSHERFGELRVFVQSWLNQTDKDFRLTVIHDGPSNEFIQIMKRFVELSSGRISFLTTERRYNDYGHSLREIGLETANGKYTLLTNADNYYVPKTVEILKGADSEMKGRSPDAIIFNMIHSHQAPGGRKQDSYTPFEVFYKRMSIDIGAAIVRTDIAKLAGFRDKTHDGDATYFEDAVRVKNSKHEQFNVCKVSRTLLVHN